MKFLIEMWSAVLPETQDIEQAIARAEQKMTEGDELLAIGRMLGVKDKKMIWDVCQAAFCQRFPEFRRRLGCRSNVTEKLRRFAGKMVVLQTSPFLYALPLIGPRAIGYLADRLIAQPNHKWALNRVPLSKNRLCLRRNRSSILPRVKKSENTLVVLPARR